MTKADVFYSVIAHLRAQNKRAVNTTGTCFYRTPEGLKCAAGYLIRDEEYDSSFEGLPWRCIASMLPRYWEYRDMISDLQHLHDSCHYGFNSPRFDDAVAVLEAQYLTAEERR